MTVLFKTELPRRKVQLKEKNLDYLKTFYEHISTLNFLPLYNVQYRGITKMNTFY